MTWVKACGMRTVADVECARAAGADAVGLVLAVSPRQVSVATARELVQAAGPVSTVLVTVDMDPVTVAAALDDCGASGVQPYGAHASDVMEMGSQRGLLILQPVPVAGDSIGDFRPAQAAIPLFDTALTDRHGGGGRAFDWSATDGYRGAFVLAGGLNPDNVATAIRQTGAWGVDASSGLESSPGSKDHQRIRDFIQGAKRQ